LPLSPRTRSLRIDFPERLSEELACLRHPHAMKPRSAVSVPLPVILSVLIWIGGAGIGSALDITTLDGITYRKCEDIRAEPDTLVFSHTNGSARINYDNLPTALKSKYFDPAKVAAYREKIRQQIQDARDAAAAKAALLQRQHDEAVAKAKAEQRAFVEETRQDDAIRRADMIHNQLAEKEEEERPQKMRIAMMAIGGLCAIALLFRVLFSGQDA